MTTRLWSALALVLATGVAAQPASAQRGTAQPAAAQRATAPRQVAQASSFATSQGCEVQSENRASIGVKTFHCQGGNCRVGRLRASTVDGVTTSGTDDTPGNWEFTVEPTLWEIRPNGPAAGRIRDGDVLVAVNGSPITTLNAGLQLAAMAPGIPLTVQVRRDQQNLRFEITPVEACWPYTASSGSGNMPRFIRQTADGGFVSLEVVGGRARSGGAAAGATGAGGRGGVGRGRGGGASAGGGGGGTAAAPSGDPGSAGAGGVVTAGPSGDAGAAAPASAGRARSGGAGGAVTPAPRGGGGRGTRPAGATPTPAGDVGGGVVTRRGRGADASAQVVDVRRIRLRDGSITFEGVGLVLSGMAFTGDAEDGTPALAFPQPPVVSSVTPGGLAERAGILPGDVVTGVSTDVPLVADLPVLTGSGTMPLSEVRGVSALAAAGPGRPVMLTILRDGVQKQVILQLT